MEKRSSKRAALLIFAYIKPRIELQNFQGQICPKMRFSIFNMGRNSLWN